MKLIPLSKRSFHAMVDDDDYENVMQHRWYADVTKWTTYAKSDSVYKRARLHTYIMQPPAGMIIHHKDKNGLNCQRENLEITYQSVNA